MRSVAAGLLAFAWLAAPARTNDPPFLLQDGLERPEPFDASPLRVNPPAFRWPSAGGGPFELQLSRTAQFPDTGGIAVRGNFYRPAEPLATGRWHWRVRPTAGEWMKPESFEIPTDLPQWRLPAWRDLLDRVPRGHPRIYLRPEQVQEYRARANGPAREFVRRWAAHLEKQLGADLAAPRRNARKAAPPAAGSATEDALRRFRWLDGRAVKTASLDTLPPARVQFVEPRALTFQQTDQFDPPPENWRLDRKYDLRNQWHLTVQSPPAEKLRYIAVLQVGKPGFAAAPITQMPGGVRVGDWNVRLEGRKAVIARAAAAQKARLKWEGRVKFGAAWEGIPEAFRNLPYPEMPLPDNRARWESERPRIRQVLHKVLGDMPPRPAPVGARMISREQRQGSIVEKLEIDNGFDSIPAYLVIPAGLTRRAPALLLLHWHSGSKEGPLFSSEVQNVAEPLLYQGFILLSIDCYFNGERLGLGPAGRAEQNIENQRDSLFKLNLWFGRTLWGMMLRDDMVAIDYLMSRPEVDSTRIGATGMSMGSTGAWWLAALDERVKAVVGVACFTRYRELIAHGQLRAHANYFFVPGILKHFDTEAVLGLLAPRPFLALTGDSDPTSPPDGIRLLEKKLEHIYGFYGAKDKFRSVVYANTDHTYTQEMKREMAAWFARWLMPAANGAR